jgi:hypothetical protein
VGEREGAEEVVSGVTELGEVVDLFVEPSGEWVFGMGAQGGECELAFAGGGESVGVGPFPGWWPWLAPPGVDFAEGSLVAGGEGAVACFSAAVGEPAAEVEAAVAFVCCRSQVSVAVHVVAGDLEFAFDAVGRVVPAHAEGVEGVDPFREQHGVQP